MKDTIYTVIRPFIKFLAVGIGTLCFVLGVLGLVTPILPHTPFFIATAVLWGYGSKRLHGWLHSLPVVGEVLTTWSEEGAIPFRAKAISVVMLLLSIVFSVSLGPWLWYQIVIPAFLSVVLWFIVSRPRPKKSPPEGVSLYVAFYLFRRAFQDGFVVR